MRFIGLMALATIASSSASAAVLQVGPGHQFHSIARAVRVARPGDIIKVWPLPDGTAYRQVAVLMKKPRITIESALPGRYVKINGQGFDYSGRQPLPRAIFQFDPTADGCTLRGFDLAGAHNNSFNGAGVRINAANHIVIRNCCIHGNDMGIMSNGELSHHTGAGQVIEDSLITKNGTFHQAGYNHNLYLGGTSALIHGCEISDSLTGHNLKSRAHITWVEYCYIHGSANRELDLVDDRGNTNQPHSDAVVLGCIIIKKRKMSGNREVINFGRDGGANHTGTLYLVHNTIFTPYYTGALVLSAPGAKLVMVDNKILNPSHHAVLLDCINGALVRNLTGAGNWISPAYGALAKRLGGPMIPWRSLKLPWQRIHLRPQPLLRFAGLGHLIRYRHPQPGAGPLRLP
ncbi:MAG: hypothetical protein HKL95_10600 [Phycisphaerae bacterium]|nr:hypothetical protein [Phycisphaerae bacterium]